MMMNSTITPNFSAYVAVGTLLRKKIEANPSAYPPLEELKAFAAELTQETGGQDELSRASNGKDGFGMVLLGPTPQDTFGLNFKSGDLAQAIGTRGPWAFHHNEDLDYFYDPEQRKHMKNRMVGSILDQQKKYNHYYHANLLEARKSSQ